MPDSPFPKHGPASLTTETLGNATQALPLEEELTAEDQRRCPVRERGELSPSETELRAGRLETQREEMGRKGGAQSPGRDPG